MTELVNKPVKATSMLLVLTEGEADILRTYMNALRTTSEAFAARNTLVMIESLKAFVKMVTANSSDHVSFQEKIMEAVHSAGYCKDPDCIYEVKPKIIVKN